MKTRVAGAKVLKIAGVTVLISVLTILGAYRISARRTREAGEVHSHSKVSEMAKPSAANGDPRWIEAYGKLPLSFEQNVGQTTQEVRFISHGAGYELFLAPQEAVLALRTPLPHDLSPRNRFKTMRALRDASRARARTAVRMRFEGANPNAQVSATDKLLKKTNYFVGSDRTKWHTDVPSYGRVKYTDIYPGVDLVFYGNQRQLEYDFVVAPGADPRAIHLNLQGARELRINARGDVVLKVPGGEVLLQKPLVYQIVKGRRQEIAGGYTLAKNHRVTFAVPSYDRNEPLILDPVLNYSTYLGGSGSDGDAPGLGIAVDSTGNAYVAGTTFSNDFPTTSSGFDPGPPASGAVNGEAFVTEMNPTGTAELYSTYLAGSTGELGVALALDPTGKIYITGLTFSSDFPTTSNALKQSPNSTNLNVGTSFISKIDPSISGANSLVYSSYIGGTGGTPALADFGNAVAADANGNAYVTGITFSPPNAGPVFALTDFPVMNAFQATPNDAIDGNAFLTRIDTTKSGNASLIYSTYLGGTGANAGALGFADAGFGVAVDSSSNAYIIGATSSTDFPTTASGLQTTSPTGNVSGTAFVTRIDTTKSGNASMVYSTYLGGETSDFGVGIALGPSNVAYATGGTHSLLFPTTTGAFQTTGNSKGVAFVSLLDTGKAGAASLQYSTFLGGTNGDTGNAIRADGTGNAYLVGSTASLNFPVTSGALEPVLPAGPGVGFVTKINPGGNGAADLVYSTYFGGSAATQEQGFSIALDASSPPNAYITGQTFSTASSFPVFPAGAFQTNLNGISDAFIAKLTLIPTFTVVPTSLDFGTQPIHLTSAAKTVSLTNNTSDAIPFPGTAVTFTGTNKADFASPSNTCAGSIAAGATCMVNVTFTPSVAAAETGTMVITVTITNGGLSSSQAFDVSLTGTGSATLPGVGLAPTSLAFGGQMLTTTSAAKTVTLTNTGGGPLTITSIAASGDFTETSTGAGACPISPNTLPAGPGVNTCTISVTFAPTAVGARNGTLTITDNANGSPHTVPLTGTGWDFTITAPTTGTVGPAAPLKFNATMTPLGGFNQAVALTCTGAPAGTTCAVVSPVTAADGTTAQTAQVTVTTTAMMIPPRSIPNPPISIRQIVPLILALMLLFMLPRTRRLRVRLGLVTAMLMLVVLAGCSGSGSKPPMNATLTITGTSTGTAGSKSHSATVALTIN